MIRRIKQELGIRGSARSPARPHNEVFVNHYYAKDGAPWLPPAWMVAETVSLGAWSLMLENLRDSSERKAVAAHFGVDESVLSGWLHVLTYVRDICAHHGRLRREKLAQEESSRLLVVYNHGAKCFLLRNGNGDRDHLVLRGRSQASFGPNRVFHGMQRAMAFRLAACSHDY